MPYRRLPTTDKARLRALTAAMNIAGKKETVTLAFSNTKLRELNQVKINFESTLAQYEADCRKQAEKNKEYKNVQDKAVMYISHFILTLNMAIERGEIKRQVLEYYGLKDLKTKLPSLAAENEIFEWAQKVIDGEQKRIQTGGSPIYTPSIALVRVNVEKYREIAIFMQNQRKICARSFEKMKKTRISANEFIGELWSEIEENLNTDLPEQNRRQAEEYGVIYVFRRREKKKLKQAEFQTDLVFEFL